MILWPGLIFFLLFVFLKKKEKNVLWVVQRPLLNASTLSSSNCSGETCKITYGSGSIAGFFSYDDVLVGDLTVKSQVNLIILTAPASSVDIYARRDCISNDADQSTHYRSSSRRRAKAASRLSSASLMAFLVLDTLTSPSAKLLRSGM